MRILAASLLLGAAACSSPQQEAREDAAARSDAIVAEQTGQEYTGEGPREQAAEQLGDDYSPSTGAVAGSQNSPVAADLPADVPEPGGQ